MQNKQYRLVIDTNLWISFIISKKFAELDELLIKTNLKLLFSAELIEELRRTVQKPKLQKYFNEENFDEMLEVFDPYIEFIEVKSDVNACRDEKDNFLFSLSKDGNADFLLTGDKDLLVLNPFENAEVITFHEFLKIIKK